MSADSDWSQCLSCGSRARGVGHPWSCGILLEEQVARFFADAEALYPYEGTREMNTLIVGKAITGFSAFV
jgi:alkylation response protein AidB-like acyl-CoA dehydrogenase